MRSSRGPDLRDLLAEGLLGRVEQQHPNVDHGDRHAFVRTEAEAEVVEVLPEPGEFRGVDLQEGLEQLTVHARVLGFVDRIQNVHGLALHHGGIAQRRMPKHPRRLARHCAALGSEAMRIKSSTQAGLRIVSLANALASVAGSPVRNRSSGKVIRSAAGSTP